MVDSDYERDIIKKISIFDVANYFIALAAEEQNCIITLLSLQKLCFYANAWSLVWDHRPLFEETFTEGKYGPFNADLSYKYKACDSLPLSLKDANPSMDMFTEKQKDMMDAVWNAYGTHGSASNKKE